MAALLASVVVVLLIAAAASRAKGMLALGSWLLIPFPVFNLVAILVELSRGAARLGVGAFETDERQLLYCIAVFVITLLAALRPKLAWLFWIAWSLNAFFGAILFYAAFFWKVFG
jgi:hypothetical protein